MIRKKRQGTRIKSMNTTTSVNMRTNIARLTNVDSRLLASATAFAISEATPTGVNL